MTIKTYRFDAPRRLHGDWWEITSPFRPGEGLCVRCPDEATAWWHAEWFTRAYAFAQLVNA